MPELVPHELIVLLNSRQKALVAISKDSDEEAYSLCPCPLTAFCVAEKAYTCGNYTLALEYFQVTCDQAAREGYVYIQMYAQSYMANCYADMGNLDAMRHQQRNSTRQFDSPLFAGGIQSPDQCFFRCCDLHSGQCDVSAYWCIGRNPGLSDCDGCGGTDLCQFLLSDGRKK